MNLKTPSSFDVSIEKSSFDNITNKKSTDDHDFERLTKRRRIISVTDEYHDGGEKSEGSIYFPSSIVNICQDFDLQHKRLEMKWEVEKKNNTILVHWWNAVQVPWDGRIYNISIGDVECNEEEKQESTKISSVAFPLQRLLYEPFPDGGFLKQTYVDVVFLNNHELFDLDQKVIVPYRLAENNAKETNEFSSIQNIEQDLRSILDDNLRAVFNSSFISKKTENLTAAEHCVMAEMVWNIKERLLRSMIVKCKEKQVEEENSAITPEFLKKSIEEIALEIKLPQWPVA